MCVCWGGIAREFFFLFRAAGLESTWRFLLGEVMGGVGGGRSLEWHLVCCASYEGEFHRVYRPRNCLLFYVSSSFEKKLTIVWVSWRFACLYIIHMNIFAC